MKPALRACVLFISILAMLPWQAAFAQPEGSDDRTLSPYFFVRSDDPTVDRLPLKSTSASVQISGVIADVLVTQIYTNDGSGPWRRSTSFPPPPEPPCTA